MSDQYPVVRAPRAPWMEFLLHFSTFGVYTCCWLVARTREMNRLSEPRFKPWLWFFVPLVSLSQPFALPKFLAGLNKLREQVDLPGWNGWHGGWVLAVCLASITLDLGNTLEIPGWLVFVCLLGWAGFFAALQGHVNAMKRSLSEVKFSGSEKGYSVLEWLILVPFLPVVTALMLYLAIEPLLLDRVSELEADSIYLDDGGLYELPIVGSGWSEVAVGTYSQDDAEVEFQGPLSHMYFVVFAHGLQQSMDDLARMRIEDAQAELIAAKCSQERRFGANRLSVVTNIQCVGSVLGAPSIQLFSFIETDAGTYELYGQLLTPQLSYRRHHEAMKKMASGFESL